uniref:Si:ch211-105j21.9 n=2 Tax=Cyprinus carpio TaxID=7962 RepID=A0A8C2ADG2_CYPCA
MGVLTLQLLVWGQLILFLLVLNNIIDAQHTSESPSSLSAMIAPPLNATGNHKENVSNSSSYSAQSDSITTQNNFTTQTTTIVSNTTLGPNQSNVTGSTGQPNTTENAQTTQSATSSALNISSTAVTSTDNTTHSSNGSAISSTTQVTKQTAITSTTVTQNSITSLNESQGRSEHIFNNVNQINEMPDYFYLHFKAGDGLNHSEKSLTILFSILFGVIVLVILGHLVYKFVRSKERSIQYTHRRLHNEDAGEPFAVPDDTLVISGGLYDGPQIYNPTMTVQNEEFQLDATGFASRPTQFRLEFLRENQERADPDTSTFQTFPAHDQEP